MDLYALLAKKSAETTTTGSTTNRAQATQGFADALSAARGRLGTGDVNAALGSLFSNSAADADAAADSDRLAAEASARRADATRDTGDEKPRLRRTTIQRRADTRAGADDAPRTATADAADVAATETPATTAVEPVKAKVKTKGDKPEAEGTATAGQASATETPAPTAAAPTMEADDAPKAGAAPVQSVVATKPEAAPQPQTQATDASSPQARTEQAADPLACIQAADIAARLEPGDEMAVTVKAANAASFAPQAAQTAEAACNVRTAQAADETETTQTARATLPRTPVPPKQIVDQVKVSIAKGAEEGLDKINIRLRPSDLGRIEVKLRVGDDGTVRAMVTADRPETLNVLKRDSAGLEKALQDAGLKTGQDSLSFSLRDQSGQGSANNDHRNKTPYGQLAAPVDDLDVADTAVAAYAGSARADGIDIRV